MVPLTRPVRQLQHHLQSDKIRQDQNQARTLGQNATQLTAP
jgi:hypothetical protein